MRGEEGVVLKGNGVLLLFSGFAALGLVLAQGCWDLIIPASCVCLGECYIGYRLAGETRRGQTVVCGLGTRRRASLRDYRSSASTPVHLACHASRDLASK